MDDALRADVGAGAAQDAPEGIEPDVVVAHEAARRLGDRVGRAVAELHAGREVDLRLSGCHPRLDAPLQHAAGSRSSAVRRQLPGGEHGAVGAIPE